MKTHFDNVLYESTLTTNDLKLKYPLMTAYFKYMDSASWYVETQLWKAHYENAPSNIVRFSHTGEIKTLEDFTEQQQQGIKYYL